MNSKPRKKRSFLVRLAIVAGLALFGLLAYEVGFFKATGGVCVSFLLFIFVPFILFGGAARTLQVVKHKLIRLQPDDPLAPLSPDTDGKRKLILTPNEKLVIGIAGTLYLLIMAYCIRYLFGRDPFAIFCDLQVLGGQPGDG